MVDLLTGDALADKIIEEISQLTVADGELMGEPFIVLDWEVEFAHGFCDQPVSAVSMAKGNGKSAFIAALATTAITPGGALYAPRRDTMIVASSLDQAREVFKSVQTHMKDRVDSDREEAKLQGGKDPWRILDSTQEGRMQYRPDVTELRLLGSDYKKAHGRKAGLFILDEPSQWEGADGGRRMFNAVLHTRGKLKDARIILLGTKPENEMHWYNHQILKNPHIFVMDFSALKDDPDYDIATIRKANPSYDHIPALREAIDFDIKLAEIGGDALLSYRALRLNKGTPEVSRYEPLIPIESWDAITLSFPEPREGPLFVGLDLGGGNSMTAVAFYWPLTGRFEAYGAYPAEPSLDSRGKADGVGGLYIEMVDRGELYVYPGEATNNGQFIQEMMRKVNGEKVEGMAADNFKRTDLKQALRLAGLGDYYDLILRRVGRGQDGGEDVRMFQTEVLEKHLNVGKSLLIRSAVRESVVTRDKNGNAGLDKGRSRGRIDPMQAGILAVGMGRRWRIPPDDDEGLDGFWNKMADSGRVVAGV